MQSACFLVKLQGEIKALGASLEHRRNIFAEYGKLLELEGDILFPGSIDLGVIETPFLFWVLFHVMRSDSKMVCTFLLIDEKRQRNG